MGHWLLTMAVFFSVATFFHQYYLTVMAVVLVCLRIAGRLLWRHLRRSAVATATSDAHEMP